MMKTMTVEQFKEWAGKVEFVGQDGSEVCGVMEYVSHIEDRGTLDEPDPVDVMGNKGFGFVWRSLEADGVTITRQIAVEWEGDSRARTDDGYKAYDSQEPEILVEGLKLVDDDGVALEAWEAADAVKDALLDQLQPDVEALIPAVTITDIDIDEDADMETFTLKNDNAPDVRFTGEMVAETSSSNNNASSYYSGTTGRWTTLKLYKTKAGTFIAQSIGYTQWQGEHTRYKVAVCESEADVIQFFGHGWLAKDLYAEAGISAVRDVE